MEKIVIAKDFVKKIKRFNLTGRTIEFKIKPIPDNEEPVRWVRDSINQVIQKGTEDLQDGDQVAFSFCSKDFQRGDGWVRFRPVEKITTSDVWEVISSVYQSNSTGLNTDTFCLSVTSVKMPAGKGKDRARRYNTFNEECGMRRGIITIKNKDNLCLPRALVVSIACADKDPDQTKVRNDTGKLQTTRAQVLLESAGVIVPEEGCGVPELHQFQNHLKNYRIVVYKYGSKGRDVIFKGGIEGSKNLNLLYHDGHFNVITSLTAAFCCVYYCEECNIPFNTKNRHRCGGTCPGCQQSPACPPTIRVSCTDCQRSFRGQACYDNHKKTGSLGKSTVCEQISMCVECFKTVSSNRKHTCGEIYCKICKSRAPAGHLCYMQSDSGKPKTDDLLFVFYDLETRQEKVLKDGSLLHEPNLCVFATRCDNCIEENNLYLCQKCGIRLQILKDPNPVTSFMKQLLEMRKKFKHVIVIAHNGQAFDHQFILNYMLTKTDHTPELIMRGSKIIMMSLGNLKFLDSLNYFPMALSKLPKAFGLGEGFKKGYFPHLFNTIENQDYVGLLPAVECYDPGNMKEDARAAFLNWHNEHKDDVFDMQRELVEYCVSDVQILAAACLKFRQQLLDTGNVCPFSEACTIASACNKVFRRNFLKPNTIGIIPRGGYRWRDNQSRIAIQWIVWEEQRRGIEILHAARQQEAVIQGVKVDGYCPETKQVFEFHGCYYHGCPTCFKHQRDKARDEDPCDTLERRYEATAAKTSRLRSNGYEVVEMWGCTFRRMAMENKEIDDLGNHPMLINTPLNPRDAFFGGRTGNIFEYYRCRQGEKIKYVDVCSLYPWVCKYGRFPIGHPKIFTGPECNRIDINNTEGIIKCKILPPQDLYHPVLPSKMHNKLLFLLCRACGEQRNQTECYHSVQERALTGTWCVDEVKKALEKGYQVLEIYEVWAYQVDQFNKVTKVGGLFTDMMNKFIKVKQQASGWPGKCVTREQRERYIENFFKREDVLLEFDEIVENPGLRSLAKLMLNSFWGKLGQRENQPKTKIVNDPCEFFNMLTNPSIVVNSVLPVNEDTLVVNWEHVDEACDPLSTVNVVIAAYVTTQARLKLYSYLEQLGERVLYYDTDSVIYVSREGEFEVPVGEFLGDMTDELECYGVGSYITDFVSGGPKNYAYKIHTGDNKQKVLCKVKGVSLTYDAGRLVNFETIKDMVLNTADPVYVTAKNIRRTNEHEVVTVTQQKIYRPNSTKRWFQENHDSVPFGYKKPKFN